MNERAYDPETKKYTGDRGNKYTVKRLMPVPYILNMQVDVWTSNTDQKLQLLEQMLVLFNPALDLQHNDNPIDGQQLQQSNLQIFNGQAEAYLQALMIKLILLHCFQIPIWINPPALAKRQNVIRNIIHNMYMYNELDH